jgi:hypothetical protein
MAEPVNPRNLIDNEHTRRMLGRKFRADRKPITRHTLIAWRASRGFPDPLDAPGVSLELWDRRAVRAWIAAQGT